MGYGVDTSANPILLGKQVANAITQYRTGGSNSAPPFDESFREYLDSIENAETTLAQDQDKVESAVAEEIKREESTIAAGIADLQTEQEHVSKENEEERKIREEIRDFLYTPKGFDRFSENLSSNADSGQSVISKLADYIHTYPDRVGYVLEEVNRNE